MGNSNNKPAFISNILDPILIEIYPPAGRRVYSARYEIVHIVSHVVIVVYRVPEIGYIQFFSNSASKQITAQWTSGPRCPDCSINRCHQSLLVKFFCISHGFLNCNLPVILERNCNVTPRPSKVSNIEAASLCCGTQLLCLLPESCGFRFDDCLPRVIRKAFFRSISLSGYDYPSRRLRDLRDKASVRRLRDFRNLARGG